jgi:hypothetical protein
MIRSFAPPTYTIEEETDPREIAAFQARQARFRRNWAWLEGHSSEVYRHRGKFICIAGEQLFVGDTVEDVLSQARAAHPEDDGRFTRYIPLERGPRIYAHRWIVAPLR